ncbi:MAG: hypothetical protein MZV70_70285 [Desulfobacterales bacterium]|nr:hypothetical protein [Desulfobacterales bacterium]
MFDFMSHRRGRLSGRPDGTTAAYSAAGRDDDAGSPGLVDSAGRRRAHRSGPTPSRTSRLPDDRPIPRRLVGQRQSIIVCRDDRRGHQSLPGRPDRSEGPDGPGPGRGASRSGPGMKIYPGRHVRRPDRLLRT